MYALYISMVQSVNYGYRMFTCAHWVCFVWSNAERNTTQVLTGISLSSAKQNISDISLVQYYRPLSPQWS